MKVVLCFGDSNTWGSVPMRDLGDMRRYDTDTRWPGVAQGVLGDGYRIIEEGLNGRTTVHDDPIEGVHKNGRRYLQACLETHRPLDLAIVMLGTNDLKKRFSLSARDIARGAGVLVEDIQVSGAGPNWGAPKVLLIAPPPLAKLDHLDEIFEGAPPTSRRLAARFEAEAAQLGCAFLDAGGVVSSSDIDGIHLEADAHRALGEAIAGEITRFLG